MTPRGHSDGCPCPYCVRDALTQRVEDLERQLRSAMAMADRWRASSEHLLTLLQRAETLLERFAGVPRPPP